MRAFRTNLILLTFCAGLLLALSATAQSANAKVDEFGVSLANTPPPIPPGFKTTDECMKAAFSGKLKVILVQAPVAIPAGVKEIQDIEYGKGGGKSLKLNLYLPENLDKPAPCLIFIHGGGWKAGDRKDYTYYCVRYAKRGFVCATISYRFVNEAPFPACVQDAKCAVRYLRANAAKYKIDPNRFAAIGGSAGGHLAMMLGYATNAPELEGDGGNPGVSSKVQAVVDLYGPCDVDCELARKADVVKAFIGKPYADAPKQYEKASPYRYITKNSPPTLIFQGTIDYTVPQAQSDQLAETLKKAGVPFEYEKFAGWPHTMDIAIEVNKCCQWYMNRFFAKFLQEKK